MILTCMQARRLCAPPPDLCHVSMMCVCVYCEYIVCGSTDALARLHVMFVSVKNICAAARESLSEYMHTATGLRSRTRTLPTAHSNSFFCAAPPPHSRPLPGASCFLSRFFRATYGFSLRARAFSLAEGAGVLQESTCWRFGRRRAYTLSQDKRVALPCGIATAWSKSRWTSRAP